ncbi:radical SAM protein [candidate division KSB1 bacterium]|nr:radical SAM protein [candidate division KSB1 bacterium]
MKFGKQLHLRITEYCNAACSFCGYNRNELQQRIKTGYKPYVLDVSYFSRLLPVLYRNGFRKLHVTGGEPLMHPLFIEFLQIAKVWHFSVQTGTNGALLDEPTVKALRENQLDFLWLSLDTFPFSDHIRHRGLDRQRENLVRGIELLQQYGINFFAQTVLSHIIPKRDGLPDLEAHIDYYVSEFNIRRFIFSYPMRRVTEHLTNRHLASDGSDTVQFTQEELINIYESIIRLKQKRRDVQIVNPYLSLWQRVLESQDGKNGKHIGCSAGKDLFFLGNDESTVRPCYYYADTIISRVEAYPMKTTECYQTCNACQDQCFRDSSIIYQLQRYPLQAISKIALHKDYRAYLMNDLWDVIRHGRYKKPPQNNLRHTG